jgi:Uma2 family endonuclease
MPFSARVRLYSPAEEVQIVGMPAHDTSVTTIEELLALPEDGMRHELLDGEHVVTPAPRLDHQAVVGDMYRIIGDALDDRDDVQLFMSPADVVLGPQTLVQPDMFVVSKEPGSYLRAWSDVGVPVLAIEILSPTTASRDRGRKRRIYQRAGVAEYWIVDVDARILERWRPDDVRPEILDGEFQWAVAQDSTLVFHVDGFFRSLPPVA